MRKFVDDKKLTHPILLMGGAVARERYAVSGFPTSFWIDREGRVVSRSVGFGPGMEVEMRKTAEELLARK